MDHHRYRQVVLSGELEVALVVRRHTHDGAGAVFDEDEVRHPDRNLLAGEGVGHRPAGIEAFLLELAGHPGRTVLTLEPLQRFGEGSALGLRPLLDECMLGRQQDEVGSEDRVDAGREDLDVIELEPRALGSSDPVALHREHFLGPLRECLGAGEQFVGVLRDPEEPLFEVTGRDGRAAAPAGAVHNLLVGEHGVAARAPVHARPPLVGDPALEHLQEDPLIPAVVLGRAGGELALPGVADADPLELALHVGDVLERPRLGMRAVLDRRVLGGQTEGVPAKGMENVEPAHPLHARDDVADHVVADVPDMRMPRWVREHLEAVELRLGEVLGHLERARVAPAFLPLFLYCLGFVIRHGL